MTSYCLLSMGILINIRCFILSIDFRWSVNCSAPYIIWFAALFIHGWFTYFHPSVICTCHGRNWCKHMLSNFLFEIRGYNCIISFNPLPPWQKDTAYVISTMLLVSGVTTILHSYFGTRLPLVQGSSFVYLAPALAIMNSREYRNLTEHVSLFHCIRPFSRIIETSFAIK